MKAWNPLYTIDFGHYHHGILTVFSKCGKQNKAKHVPYNSAVAIPRYIVCDASQ